MVDVPPNNPQTKNNTYLPWNHGRPSLDVPDVSYVLNIPDIPVRLKNIKINTLKKIKYPM